MRFLKILLYSIVVAGHAHMASAELFEGAIDAQIVVPSQVNVTSKILIKGNMVRTEAPLQVFNSVTTAYSIVDFEKHQQIRIWPDKKTAVIEPWEPKTLKGMKVPEFTKTGVTDKILGYPVMQFIIRAPDGEFLELWSTTELNFARPVLQISSSGLPQGDGWQETEYFKKGYYSLRTIHKAANGTVKFKLEVKKVERKPLAPDLFTIPSGYQTTDRSVTDNAASSTTGH
jgi:hypothetical protein